MSEFTYTKVVGWISTTFLKGNNSFGVFLGISQKFSTTFGRLFVTRTCELRKHRSDGSRKKTILKIAKNSRVITQSEMKNLSRIKWISMTWNVIEIHWKMSLKLCQKFILIVTSSSPLLIKLVQPYTSKLKNSHFAPFGNFVMKKCNLVRLTEVSQAIIYCF